MTEGSHLRLECRDRTLRLEIDGRSLVCLDGEAVLARHPLRRLHRVSLRGKVLVHTETLAALSSAGVPMAILAADGSISALVPPRWRPAGLLGSELERLSPDTLCRICEDWRLAEVSRHARALGMADPAGAARSGWQGAELLLRATQPELPSAAARRMVNEATSFCRLLALRELCDQGIRRRWLGDGAAHDPDLCQTFAQTLLWRLLRFAILPRLRRDIRKALDHDGNRWNQRVAELAERARAPLRAGLLRDLHRFHLHLIDLRLEHRWHG